MFWKRRRDEDDIDRVNRVCTVLILVVAGISAIVYVAVFPDPAISCVKIKKDDPDVVSTTYVNKYCLDEGSLPGKYYHDLNFSYHIYVPLFLFYQALGFMAPHVLAQLLKRVIGSDCEFLFMYAETAKGVEVLNRMKHPPKPSSKNAVMYILKKVLYLVNSFIQLLAIAVLFSPDKSLNGIKERNFRGYSRPPFPKTGRCSFDFEDSSTQYYQCTFHVNGVYHKFYLVHLYWLLVVFIVNIVSLVVWILLLLLPRMTSQKIRLYISVSSEEEVEFSEKQQTFMKDYLGKDFLLNLLLTQYTEREVTAADLTLKLWQSYHMLPTDQLQNSPVIEIASDPDQLQTSPVIEIASGPVANG